MRIEYNFRPGVIGKYYNRYLNGVKIIIKGDKMSKERKPIEINNDPDWLMHQVAMEEEGWTGCTSVGGLLIHALEEGVEAVKNGEVKTRMVDEVNAAVENENMKRLFGFVDPIDDYMNDKNIGMYAKADRYDEQGRSLRETCDMCDIDKSSVSPCYDCDDDLVGKYCTECWDKMENLEYDGTYCPNCKRILACNNFLVSNKVDKFGCHKCMPEL